MCQLRIACVYVLFFGELYCFELHARFVCFIMHHVCLLLLFVLSVAISFDRMTGIIVFMCEWKPVT